MKQTFKYITRTKTYIFSYDSNGNYFYNGKQLKFYKNRKTNYFATTFFDNGKRQMVYQHRLVAAAYHKVPAGYKMWELQVDHINNKPWDNSPSNLRFVTRLENNSRLHSRRLKSKNAHNTSHKHEVVKIVSGENVIFCENTVAAAKLLKCSTPSIHICLKNNWKVKGCDVCRVPKTSKEYLNWKKEHCNV